MKQNDLVDGQQATLYQVDDTTLTLFGELTGLPFTVYLNSTPEDWVTPIVIVKLHTNVYLAVEEPLRVIPSIGTFHITHRPELKKLKKWVTLNKEIITEFWNGKVSAEDVVHNQTKLRTLRIRSRS